MNGGNMENVSRNYIYFILHLSVCSNSFLIKPDNKPACLVITLDYFAF